MARMILFLLFLLFPLQYSYPQDKSRAAGEEEVAEQYTWDFGQVKEGEVLKHAFILKNESGKTLTIKEINTSCGCTASKTEKSLLAPGEDTEIEVQFKSEGYSGATRQYVYVHTDSPDEPIIRLIIKATVTKNRDVFQTKAESVPEGVQFPD